MVAELLLAVLAFLVSLLPVLYLTALAERLGYWLLGRAMYDLSWGELLLGLPTVLAIVVMRAALGRLWTERPARAEFVTALAAFPLLLLWYWRITSHSLDLLTLWSALLGLMAPALVLERVGPGLLERRTTGDRPGDVLRGTDDYLRQGVAHGVTAVAAGLVGWSMLDIARALRETRFEPVPGATTEMYHYAPPGLWQELAALAGLAVLLWLGLVLVRLLVHDPVLQGPRGQAVSLEVNGALAVLRGAALLAVVGAVLLHALVPLGEAAMILPTLGWGLGALPAPALAMVSLWLLSAAYTTAQGEPGEPGDANAFWVLALTALGLLLLWLGLPLLLGSLWPVGLAWLPVVLLPLATAYGLLLSLVHEPALGQIKAAIAASFAGLGLVFLLAPEREDHMLAVGLVCLVVAGLVLWGRLARLPGRGPHPAAPSDRRGGRQRYEGEPGEPAERE